MRISNLKNLQFSNFIQTKKQTTFSQNNGIGYARQLPSAEHIRANFCPSFGAYKIINKVYLTDKKTGESVKATIKKDSFGDDDIAYKLMVGRKEGGFLDLKFNTENKKKFDAENKDENTQGPFPEVVHLRSLLGNKYRGIGSALLETAIEESKKRGNGGALFLISCKGYAYAASKYRSNENPIPFYYKFGFRSCNEEEDKQIKKCLENSDYESLPALTYLELKPNLN